MTHHYCACPWCQGPGPVHPTRSQDQQIRDAREEYEQLLKRLTETPAAPYTSEWGLPPRRG